MSTDQHFCLKWNNHQDTLISLFSSLLDSNTFVDCTLAAGGKQIKAHKMILSACSPYFKDILLEYGDTHPIIILNNVQFSELVAIVEFMYRGEVNVAQEQLPLFLKAATALQVKGLTDNKSDGGTSEDGGRDDDDDDEEGYTSEVSSTGATPRGGIVNDRADPNSLKIDSSLGLQDITTGTSADDSQGPGPSNDCYEQESKPNIYDRNSSFLGLLQQQNFYKFGEDNLSTLSGLPVGNSALAAAYGKMIQLRRPNATEKDASFRCEVCSKFYRSKTSLNLHKRWECGKEPKFACPYCDKRCHQKDTWSGGRRCLPPLFSCGGCGKSYRWKSTLRRHEEFECGGKRPSHPCPYCDYAAKQKGNLLVHMRKHHSGIIDAELDLRVRKKVTCEDNCTRTVHRSYL